MKAHLYPLELPRAEEHCTCEIREGMTYAELRTVESCQDRYICPTLDRARRQAQKREQRS